MSYCYWLIHKAYHWKGVKELYKMGYNKSYFVHPCFYKSSIIESHFVFGQMKWRYRINVSDNYQNKSYNTMKDLALPWYIQTLLDSNWNINLICKIHIVRLFFFLLTKHIIMKYFYFNCYFQIMSFKRVWFALCKGLFEIC